MIAAYAKADADTDDDREIPLRGGLRAFPTESLAWASAQLALKSKGTPSQTGFADLFAQVTANPSLHPARDGAGMGLTFANYAKVMGYPRRGLVKLVRDLSLKIIEKLRK